MNHVSEPGKSIPNTSPGSSRRAFAEKMPAALRALALGLGTSHFSGLSICASRRLSFACNGFAELIRAAETTPDVGMSVRARACFLLCALGALRTNTLDAPLSRLDEAWIIAEIEADFGEAIALFEARTGRPRSPVPPRPALPVGSCASSQSASVGTSRAVASA